MNAVLTCWFQRPDPMRENSVDPRAIDDVTSILRKSITGGELVTLTSERTPFQNVYLDRWPLYVEWLDAHPEAEWVWCVDAGDVEMLHEPWEKMEQGILYAGWEDHPVYYPWMVQHHPAAFLQEFFVVSAPRRLRGERFLRQGPVGNLARRVIPLLGFWALPADVVKSRRNSGMPDFVRATDYRSRPWPRLHRSRPSSVPILGLNAGVVGGDRATVLEFCRAMVALAEEHGDLGTDMGPFNYLAYTQFGDRLRTGLPVTTRFLGFEPDNGFSWWRHK